VRIIASEREKSSQKSPLRFVMSALTITTLSSHNKRISMQIGATFPQNEIGANPQDLRTYVLAIESMGYSHLVAYDHVVGAGPSHGPNNYSSQLFHEPLVLFGYFAALSKLELATAVLILPQRQTALVAKQAAEISILNNGKFRLGVGVGWNHLEYDALGMDFRERGRVLNEQIQVLRKLWSNPSVTFNGEYHNLPDVGLNPPVRHPIPIWIGGHSEAALHRTAKYGDGWLPQGRPDSQMKEQITRIRRYAKEAGRDPAKIGIDARIEVSEGDLDSWLQQTEGWRKLGATHVSLNTMKAGFSNLDQHLDALRRYREAVSE
jgi:probable F420-dependent oxidoreductase